MNKQAFMEQLRQALAGRLSPRRIEEILADFEDHFQEALLAGESEEKVCRILGDPAEIAAQCIDSQIWGAGEALSPVGGSPAAATGEIRRFTVSLLDAGLVCRRGGGDSFHAEIRKNGVLSDDESIHFRLEGDEFRVWQDDIDKYNFLNSLFRLTLHREVCVEVPASFAGSVEIHLASSGASVSDLGNLEQFFCSSASGGVKVSNLAARRSLTAKSQSGNVVLAGCAGTAKAESSSGSVKIDGHDGDIKAESISGGVRLENVTGDAVLVSKSGTVSAKAHSGNVKAESLSGSVNVDTDVISRSTELSSVSGSVTLKLGLLSGNLLAESKSGSVRLDIHKVEGNITGKSLSGSVVATVGPDTNADVVLRGIMKAQRYRMGAGGSLPKIELSSVSGSTSVNCPPYSD